MDTLFGSMIRMARERLRKTQKGIAKGLGLKQSTVSAWETGRQFPKKECLNEILEKLARILELPIEELEKAVSEQHGQGQQGPGMDESQYLHQQQAYLKACGYDVDLWILGSEALSVTSSEKVKQTWIENIKLGTRYHIVWFLDLLTEPTFRKLAKTISDISHNINELAGGATKGKIVHYGTSVVLSEAELSDSTASTDPSNQSRPGYCQMPLLCAQARKNLVLYNQLRNKRLSGNELLPFIHGDRLKPIPQQMLQFWNSFGTTAVYIPRDITVERRATIGLQSVYPGFGPTKVNVWFYLDSQHVDDLCGLVLDFEEAYGSQKSTGSLSK